MSAKSPPKMNEPETSQASFSPTSQEEEGIDVAVGNKIVKMKHVASIEDHAHSDNLKNTIVLVLKIPIYAQSLTRREGDKSRLKKKKITVRNSVCSLGTPTSPPISIWCR